MSGGRLAWHCRAGSIRGPVFEWVGCVAYALLAGLIARMIILPVGPLQETDLGSRLVSAAIALAVFFIMRKSIFSASPPVPWR